MFQMGIDGICSFTLSLVHSEFLLSSNSLQSWWSFSFSCFVAMMFILGVDGKYSLSFSRILKSLFLERKRTLFLVTHFFSEQYSTWNSCLWCYGRSIFDSRCWLCRFLETLLSKYLESCPLSLPKLHHQFEQSGPFHSKKAFGCDDKNEQKRVSNLASPKLKKNKRIAKSQTDSSTDGKLRQPTIVDVLKRAGVLTNKPEANDHPSTLSSRSTSHSGDQNSSDYDESLSVEVSTATKILDLQRFKFRPLLLQCYSIMTFSKVCL